MTATMPSASSIKSATRVLDILEFLAENSQEWLTLTALAKQLQIPKSSLHGLVGVLTARGYLERASTSQRYRLGPRSCGLGASYLAGIDLHQAARPVMAVMGRLSSETIMLDILRDGSMITIAREDARHPFRLVTRIGTPFAAYATASGKVMLASLPEAMLQALFSTLELRPLTANTLTTVQRLREQLEEIRRSGVAYAHGELNEGVEAIAAPIIGHEGQPIAALDAVVPAHRAERGHLRRVERLIRAGAQVISARMGAPPHAAEVAVDPNTYLQHVWNADGMLRPEEIHA